MNWEVPPITPDIRVSHQRFDGYILWARIGPLTVVAVEEYMKIAVKNLLLTLLLLTFSVNIWAAPQDDRAPLSKDEVMDLLTSSTPSKIIISTIERNGIAFRPTGQILEEFRKAGADKGVLAALHDAWHEDVPKPLTDNEIRMMLAEDTPSQSILRTLHERGIDFQPAPDYLQALRSEGASDDLLEALRTTAPRPFSKAELLQEIRTRVDQNWLAERLRVRGIDFAANDPNLSTLRNAGAQKDLVEAVRAAKHAKPFQPVSAAAPKLTAPLVEGKTAALICEPSDADVPVFAEANDLGKVAVRLRCGEQVTFLERMQAPKGVDKIQYAGSKVGYVASAFLESAIATVGGDVAPPTPKYKPDPGYTPEARRKGIEGTVRFSIIIDTQGSVSDIQQTSQPLGGGLDQKALETVKQWRFNPATRNGVPVAVRVMAEVSFHLYHHPR